MSPVRIEVHTHGEICVLQVSGRITHEPGETSFEDRFTEQMDAGERLFLLDMRRVPYMDSSGLAEIIACNRKLREHEGIIKLVLTEKLRGLFNTVFLHQVFEIFDDLDEALNSFSD